MANVLALRQDQTGTLTRTAQRPRLSTEQYRTVMLRRGAIIRALRRRLGQLFTQLSHARDDLAEANAYIRCLENENNQLADQLDQYRTEIGR